MAKKDTGKPWRATSGNAAMIGTCGIYTGFELQLLFWPQMTDRFRLLSSKTTADVVCCMRELLNHGLIFSIYRSQFKMDVITTRLRDFCKHQKLSWTLILLFASMVVQAEHEEKSEFDFRHHGIACRQCQEAW